MGFALVGFALGALQIHLLLGSQDPATSSRDIPRAYRTPWTRARESRSGGLTREEFCSKDMSAPKRGLPRGIRFRPGFVRPCDPETRP